MMSKILMFVADNVREFVFKRGSYALVTRRLFFYSVAFFCAASFNFILPRIMPGDPAIAMFSSQGTPLTREALQALRETFGFIEGSLFDQYITYLKSVFTWDLGYSVQYFPLSVNEVLNRSLYWTVFLVGTSSMISFSLGSLAGIYAAWHHNGLFDKLFTPLSLVLQSIPALIISLLFLFVFGITLKWLPSGYAFDIDLDPSWGWQYISSVLEHAIMPVTTLVIVQIGGYLITFRNNMINILGEDYILLARAKGLSDTRIMLNYGARNAMLPSLTTFAITIGLVLGGSLITECAFNYPGLGNTLYQAIISRDYPVIQGELLMITLAMLSMNFLVDIAYVYIDPRLRSS